MPGSVSCLPFTTISSLSCQALKAIPISDVGFAISIRFDRSSFFLFSESHLLSLGKVAACVRRPSFFSSRSICCTLPGANSFKEFDKASIRVPAVVVLLKPVPD